MITTTTPKQRLEKDRVRQQARRAELYAQGLTQHIVWVTPLGWASLENWLLAAGPDLVGQKNRGTGRATGTGRDEGGATHLGEESYYPAHLSDNGAGENKP